MLEKVSSSKRYHLVIGGGAFLFGMQAQYSYLVTSVEYQTASEMVLAGAEIQTLFCLFVCFILSLNKI